MNSNFDPVNEVGRDDADKKSVLDFWDNASCGEDLYLRGDDERGRYQNQRNERYRLEPYILPFASAEETKEKRVLEIGVGLGADHQLFGEAGAVLSGCDLTPRAIEHTRKRIEIFGLRSDLRTADAENLPYQDESFDFVYSWGVIHHSPNTRQAAREIHRVLRSGGEARVMIYHKFSIIGLMLWTRYALLRLRPWTSLDEVYARHLESPGTKAYSVADAKELFSDFRRVKIETVLTHGDLLDSDAGQRHRGPLLSLAKSLFPRRLVRRFFPNAGLYMLVSLEK